ncbi:MAG: Ig-like domain-containing protein, partial [Solirubrobacteraceae bacterium]|nr:Ig-like domain-containing protein [Solirubrobacteraceae bacterium]
MGALAVCVVTLAGAPAAVAQDGGVGAAAIPQFPSTVTVGAQDVPVSLLVENRSTGEYADDNFQVNEITLTPSCGSQLGFGLCPVGAFDPGVFAPSATGVGRAGTACAGQTFNITLLDPASGRYTFAPVGGPVVLGPVGSPADHCIIDFTVDVVRAPAIDADPAQTLPGPLQTIQYATVTLTDITPGPTFGIQGSGTGSDETTVLQATPLIATQVNDATITLGQSFTDTATIGFPAGSPSPTGTVNFFVYGPNDATCAGAPVFSSLNRPVGAGASATSASFTPTAPGTYRVIAVYSGDVNYTAVSGACNDPNETVVVAPATPTIATAVNDATLTLGQSFTDTATVTGFGGGPTPTGTVNFFVYAPGDTTCTGAPVFTSLNRPLAGGTATSGTFTPNAAGTYRVIAVYSGDANYTTVSGACNDANETVVVDQATPTIATAVNDGTITLGQTFTDTATVTGVAGGPTPTGDVDFFVYGPGDTTCTGAPVFSSLNRPLTGGTATSGTFTPNAAGTYRVIAVYSGDANYDPVSGLCNDANETVVVDQATPTIATAVNDGTITLGQTF